MSLSAKVRAILFGATGSLGGWIGRGIISPQYKDRIDLTIVLRSINPSNPSKLSLISTLKEGGAHVVVGDVDNDDVESLSKLLSGQDVLLSALNFPSLEPGQVKLIEAAKIAKIKHFIPSEFGVDVSKMPPGGPVPQFAAKVRIQEALKSSGLSYTFISSGFFMEHVISPFRGVDVLNARVTAPGSVKSAITATALPDIGLLTAEIVANYERPYVKNQHVYLGAQTITYDEIADLLEKKYNKKFERVVVSSEVLAKQVEADVAFKNWSARFQIIIGNQYEGVSWDVASSYPAKHAPSIKLTTVADYIAKLP